MILLVQVFVLCVQVERLMYSPVLFDMHRLSPKR